MASDKEIQNYGYKLWQEAGCPEGQDDEFWQKAKTELGQPRHCKAASAER